MNCTKLNKHHVLKQKRGVYKCRYCTYTLSVDTATQLILDGKYGKMYGANDKTIYEQAQLEG